MITSTRQYKGHTITKIVKRNRDPKRGSNIEYYTINGKGYFLYLKDAKAAIDKQTELEELNKKGIAE